MPKAFFGFGFGPKATANIDGMPSGKLRAQVLKKAKSLIENPRPRGCKKLNSITEGVEAVWRVRSGDYRILYLIRDTEVVVLDVGHRKDVYKR